MPISRAICLIILALGTFLVLASSRPSSSRPSSSRPSPFNPNTFLICISSHSQPRTPPPTAFYSPYTNKTAFTAFLNATGRNLLLLGPSIAKPELIFTPLYEIHVKAAVMCAQSQGVNFRVRSGGHDYEGLSYISYTGKQFIIIDLSRLRDITVDITTRSAWAQAGASIGELYYKISQASNTLGFPAGVCTTLGLGGHLSGGAYGTMLRSSGLGDDHILDARIVTAVGDILTRDQMGEDLFWAIRGGAGGSFGIVLSWKVRLVSVPEKVTVFTVTKGGPELFQRWQHVAPNMGNDVFIRALLIPANGNVLAQYQCLYLGDKNSLYKVMRNSFPELCLKKKDATEMRWIESILYFAGYPSNFTADYLLQAKPAFIDSFKAKSDFLLEAIPDVGVKGLWKRLTDDGSVVIFSPFGGKMTEIDEDEIPFPHRNVMAMIQYVAQWGADQTNKQQHLDWVRGLYDYMTPFVSSKPREAYVNYRDLDIGKDGSGSNCSIPRLWGPKYFKGNFDRLVTVKTQVDPSNIFNYEQSIPTWNTIGTCTQMY